MLKPNYRVCIKRHMVSYAYVDVTAENRIDAIKSIERDLDVKQMSDDKFDIEIKHTKVIDAWPKKGEVSGKDNS